MNKSKKYILSFVCILFGLLLFFNCIHAARQAQPLSDTLGQSYDLRSDYLITQYADATGQHGTFYTIENSESLIILDGGWSGNADAVRSVIAANDNTVNAWIISHPHQDHAGAFNSIFSDLQGITIEHLYDNSFDYDFVETNGEPYDDISVMETYHALTLQTENLTHLKRGDQLDICGLTVNVLNAYDDQVIENVGGEKDYQNNASLMLRITNQTESILFCSDIKYDMESFLTASIDPELLSCKYLQVGHHGNWSFSEDFYTASGASVYFFDAPSAITDSPDYPASALKNSLLSKGKTVLDFSTAPNSVCLK